jgi:hypothetical protein
MPTSFQVELRFWSDDPKIAELRTSAVGRTWTQGDAVPGSPVMRRKMGGWAIASVAAFYADLEDHIASVLAQSEPIWPQLLAAAPHAHVELSIALYMSRGAQPGGQVLRHQLSRLAELGAEVDLDLYPWIRRP